MYVKDIFADRDAAAALSFIEDHRLGTTITSTESSGLTSSQLPYVVDRTRGRQGTLVSHVPLASPQHQALSEGAECLIVFVGASGYISPSWFPPSGRRSAPTWNFSVVQVKGEATRLSRAATAEHLSTLVNEMEQDRPDKWRLAEMGPRFSQLLDHVVGFEVTIGSLIAKHKMGQDERPDDAIAAIQKLQQGTPSQQALSAAMRNKLKSRLVGF